MKAKELIDNLRTNFEQLNSEISSLTDGHILYMLDEARATYAGRKMDARIDIARMIQHVDAEVVEVDPEVRGEMGTVGEFSLAKIVIPSTINYGSGGAIISVGSTDGVESLTKISYSEIRTALSRRYTGSTPKWFLFDNNIYLLNLDLASQELVRVRAIFDRPIEVEEVMGRHKELTPFDFEYPMSLKDATPVYQLALEQDLGWGDTAAQAIATRKAKAKKDNQLLDALKSGVAAKPAE